MDNLAGKKFGRLQVVKRAGVTKWGNVNWLCKCDCGNEHIAAADKLKKGKVKSCGCYKKEMSIRQLEKHGITTGGKPRTLVIWNGIKARCLNPNSISYKSYGARGIRICDEWLQFENFHNWAIENGYQESLTIDRINNDGNYEPSNCQWVNPEVNKRKQRNVRSISIQGETKSVSQWCKDLKISKSTAYKYLNKSEKDFVDYVSGKGQIYFINKFLKESEVAVAASDE